MRKVLAVVLIVVAGVFLLSVPSAFSQGEPCTADFNCDENVDATDVSTFLGQFGRNPFNEACPDCYDSPCPCSSTVPRTGQTTSYATGDDGDLEKGLIWPNPRFTDNGDGTVTDNLTNLVWLKDASCFELRTWNEALSDSNGLASGSCGLTDSSSSSDWRLPNISELESLRHRGYYNRALSNTAGTGQWSEGDPFTDVKVNYYWSSTTVAGNTNEAWFVNMTSGRVDRLFKTSHYYVWPVRDPL